MIGGADQSLQVNGITNKPNIMCFIVKLYSETFMFQRCDILTHAVCSSQTVINKNIQMRHTETLNRFPVILMFRNYSRCTYMFRFETFSSLSVVKSTPSGTILGRLSFNVSIAVSRSSNGS